MCERKGYFGLSKKELEENPQCRALADDGVVAEKGWDKRKQAEVERRIAASEKQTNYKPSPYDLSE